MIPFDQHCNCLFARRPWRSYASIRIRRSAVFKKCPRLNSEPYVSQLQKKQKNNCSPKLGSRQNATLPQKLEVGSKTTSPLKQARTCKKKQQRKKKGFAKLEVFCGDPAAVMQVRTISNWNMYESTPDNFEQNQLYNQNCSKLLQVRIFAEASWNQSNNIS